MTQDYKILLDIPLRTSKDGAANLALGFDELATAFQEAIEHSDPQFAIGLFGGWGSGKTTLMRAIESKLDKKTCATVWFSAWRYEKEEHLITPLLDVIREGIVDWADRNANQSGNARDTAMRVASTIGKVVGSLMAGLSVKVGVPGGPQLSYDVNKALISADKFDEADMAARVPRSYYHASFVALQHAFSQFTERGARRIVVFVDDLDRCLPEGALDVLESMKLFFDLAGFVFVVGVDRHVVEMSVDKRYREMMPSDAPDQAVQRNQSVTGAQYLRKIFQVPYGLAPVSAEQINDFLWSIQTHADLPPPQWQEIDQNVSPHLRYLVDDSGVNPREIKRYINGYTLVRKINPLLDTSVVLALQTLAFRPDWSEIQIALLAYRDVFIDALKRQNEDPEAQHLGALSPSLESPPQSFLTYIGAGEPGEALVLFAQNAQSIDEFIYSGEASRSSESSNFANAFQALGAAILGIRTARENQGQLTEVLSACNQTINILAASDESASAMGRYGVTRRELETLINEIKSSPWDSYMSGNNTSGTEDAEQRIEALALSWTEKLRSVMANLQELYRAGLT
ncbi:MAG: P-loop NTPase fold protein [Stappiaceae bacterium]